MPPPSARTPPAAARRACAVPGSQFRERRQHRQRSGTREAESTGRIFSSASSPAPPHLAHRGPSRRRRGSAPPTESSSWSLAAGPSPTARSRSASAARQRLQSWDQDRAQHPGRGARPAQPCSTLQLPPPLSRAPRRSPSRVRPRRCGAASRRSTSSSRARSSWLPAVPSGSSICSASSSCGVRGRSGSSSPRPAPAPAAPAHRSGRRQRRARSAPAPRVADPEFLQRRDQLLRLAPRRLQPEGQDGDPQRRQELAQRARREDPRARSHLPQLGRRPDAGRGVGGEAGRRDPDPRLPADRLPRRRQHAGVIAPWIPRSPSTRRRPPRPAPTRPRRRSPQGRGP